jgi:hypothetical protein
MPHSVIEFVKAAVIGLVSLAVCYWWERRWENAKSLASYIFWFGSFLLIVLGLVAYSLLDIFR